MEIRVLRYFLTVAREGSITGAANYLHLTQPTLSRQLMDLEKELGQKLLIRTNHNVSLTPEGMILRKRAEEILDMVEKTENEFSSLKDEISGEIYIGSGETETLKSIAGLIKEIRKSYPKIIFHLNSGIHEDVVEKIDNGLLDFGIVMSPVDLSKYNVINLPENDIWGLVMRKDSKLAEKEFVTFEDMKKIPLILSRKVFRKPTPDDEFFRWFNKNKDKLNIAATHTLFYNAAVMVEEGVGYMFTLDNLANTSKAKNLCFRPIKPKMSASWGLIWKKYQVFSPAAKLFLDKIQEKYERGQI
ncbi:MAG: LysR family transcriptional regulator [bacterium]|nr:LysR family transcriptional regulator [bacterium]